jgi:glucan phosphoethanolaminetransferase (alkaline phosphatase superfamily)
MNNSILSDVYIDILSYFDSNNNDSVDYYEIYPVFLFLAVFLIYYLILINLSIVIIFKQSYLFIAFFTLILLYSVLNTINYTNKVKYGRKLGIKHYVQYWFNVINIFISGYAIIYLASFFIK